MTADRQNERVAALMAADEPMLALAELLVAQAGEEDPLLAELISLSAIPRKFDRALLALLSDQSVESPEFGVAFGALVDSTSVLRQRDGGYRLHDEVRRALLARWKSTDDGRKRLYALNSALAENYETEHQSARMLADHLAVIDGVVREVNPKRLRKIRDQVEDRLVRPLIDTLHYRMAADPGAGLDSFIALFGLYEREERLGVCTLLHRAWIDEVARLESAKPSFDDWTAYYEARLARGYDDNEGALEIARRLVAADGTDGGVRARAQALCSTILDSQNLFVEALESIDMELSIRDPRDPDPATLPNVYLRQASIHRQLWDEPTAVASLERALASCAEVLDVETEILTRTRLSASLSAQGLDDSAAEHGVRALHLARTLPPPRAQTSAETCARLFLTTFGEQTPRLADLFHVECRHLTRPDDYSRAPQPDERLCGGARDERSNSSGPRADRVLGHGGGGLECHGPFRHRGRARQPSRSRGPRTRGTRAQSPDGADAFRERPDGAVGSRRLDDEPGPLGGRVGRARRGVFISSEGPCPLDPDGASPSGRLHLLDRSRRCPSSRQVRPGRRSVVQGR